MKYEKPVFWGIYEREPLMNPEPNMLIMGPYHTELEAVRVANQHGFTTDNYYITTIKGY